MSISTLTTLATARNFRRPTKRDLGKATTDKAVNSPSLPDLLVTMVPTGLVAPYTALVAALVGTIEKSTPTNPSPNQLLLWRWLGFAILIFATVSMTYGGYQRKAGAGKRFPLLEIAGATIAAAAWALAMPESPLIATLNGAARIAAPLVIAFAAVAIDLVIATFLRKQARS